MRETGGGVASLMQVNYTDRKGLKTMQAFNLCYTVLLNKPAGANIAIIKRGERGYTPTNLDWGTGDTAAELVRAANARRGIDAAAQLDFEIKSMFIWPKAEAAEAPALADLITADNAKLYALVDDKLVFCADISGLRVDNPQVLAIENALIKLCEADDGDDWSPREPLQFIPHASDYSRFD
jgi:hypothetical protein